LKFLKGKKGFRCKAQRDPVVVSGERFSNYKKIKKSSLSERFDNLSTTISIKFRKRGITQADIQRAIQWSRKRVGNFLREKS